jgi:uncharacterized membrane protein YgcG
MKIEEIASLAKTVDQGVEEVFVVMDTLCLSHQEQVAFLVGVVEGFVDHDPSLRESTIAALHRALARLEQRTEN